MTEQLKKKLDPLIILFVPKYIFMFLELHFNILFSLNHDPVFILTLYTERPIYQIGSLLALNYYFRY